MRELLRLLIILSVSFLLPIPGVSPGVVFLFFLMAWAIDDGARKRGELPFDS